MGMGMRIWTTSCSSPIETQFALPPRHHRPPSPRNRPSLESPRAVRARRHLLPLPRSLPPRARLTDLDLLDLRKLLRPPVQGRQGAVLCLSPGYLPNLPCQNLLPRQLHRHAAILRRESRAPVTVPPPRGISSRVPPKPAWVEFRGVNPARRMQRRIRLQRILPGDLLRPRQTRYLAWRRQAQLRRLLL